MSRCWMTCAALLLCLGGGLRSAWGQSPAPVDVQKSFAVIFVDKVGLGHQHAMTCKLREGRIELGAKAGAGRLVFDMASFVADTPEGRRYLNLPGSLDAATRKQVTETMLGKDVLDAKRFPTAVFEIQAATLVSEKSQGNALYALQGKFTLHGATRPLEIRAEASSEAGRTRLKGEFPLVQSQFGIKPYSKALGAVGVADRLTVHGEIYLQDAK